MLLTNPTPPSPRLFFSGWPIFLTNTFYRCIYGEFLKKHPEAQYVIYSHSIGVLSFAAADVPARPVYHMAAFLGSSGPRTFDVTPVYDHLQKEHSKSHSANGRKIYDAGMLIKTPALGAALTEAFKEDIPVLFQWKHGFTCWDASMQEAVYYAIYTQGNCEILQGALGHCSGDS